MWPRVVASLAVLVLAAEGQVASLPGLFGAWPSLYYGVFPKHPSLLRYGQTFAIPGLHRPFIQSSAPVLNTGAALAPPLFRTGSERLVSPPTFLYRSPRLPVLHRSGNPTPLSTSPGVVKPILPDMSSYSNAGVAPTTLTAVQYHAQDEIGQYSFGYANALSSRTETKDAQGTVRGAFTYLDPNGEVQHQSYVADDNGFRVAGTNLPVRPSGSEDQSSLTPASAVVHSPVPALLSGPVITHDTPRVIATAQLTLDTTPDAIIQKTEEVESKTRPHTFGSDFRTGDSPQDSITPGSQASPDTEFKTPGSPHASGGDTTGRPQITGSELKTSAAPQNFQIADAIQHEEKPQESGSEFKIPQRPQDSGDEFKTPEITQGFIPHERPQGSDVHDRPQVFNVPEIPQNFDIHERPQGFGVPESLRGFGGGFQPPEVTQGISESKAPETPRGSDDGFKTPEKHQGFDSGFENPEVPQGFSPPESPQGFEGEFKTPERPQELGGEFQNSFFRGESQDSTESLED